MLARKHIGDLGEEETAPLGDHGRQDGGDAEGLGGLARPAVLLITVCGSWLFTFAS